MRQRAEVRRTVVGLVAAAIVAMVVVLTPAAGFADDAGPDVPVAVTATGAGAEPQESDVVSADPDAIAAPEPAGSVEDAAPADPAGESEDVGDPEDSEGSELGDVVDPTEDSSPLPSPGSADDRPVTLSPSAATDVAAEPVALPALELHAYVRDATGDWLPLAGDARFGEQIRYVARLTVPSGTALADAELTATVPGYGGSQDRTTLPSTLEPGSVTCDDMVLCAPSANQVSGQVGWRFGDLAPAVDDRVIESAFVVRFGELPPKVDFDASGRYVATSWTRAELTWDVDTEEAGRVSVASNAVVATAVAMQVIQEDSVHEAAPTPHADISEIAGLPATGGPWRGWFVAGLLSLAAGVTVLVRARRS